MRGIHSAVDDIRRNVFTEVARLAYEGGDYSRIDLIPYKIVPGEESQYRSNVFLARAIVQERLRLACGLPLQPVNVRAPASAGIEEAAAANDKFFEEPLVNVITFACNACPPKQVRVTDSCQGCMDGKAVAFTYDATKGTLTAALPISDTNAHRVTVTAKDASGNIGRASCDIAATGGASQFSDTAGYWAGTYVDWLKTTGITTGFEDGTFRPNQSITRQQFAVMLYRYLGLDGTKYASVSLPFADNGEIGEYAQTAIKTLYSMSNKSRDGYAYTVVDLDTRIDHTVIDDVKALKGVIRVRVIE